MPVAALALLGALVTKVVDFARQVRAKDWNAAVTQLVAWGAGIAGAFLLAASDFAGRITFDQLGGYALEDLNGASLTFLGMSVLSVFSKLVDVQKAVDGSQSAAVPPLLADKTLPPAAVVESSNERYVTGRLASDPATIAEPTAKRIQQKKRP